MRLLKPTIQDIESSGPRQALLAVLLLTACFNEGRKSHRPDGAPPPSPCPAEMAFVSEVGVCIDRYEASNVNGTATSQEGALPWHSITFAAAFQACEAVGKRLCDDHVWTAACSGPEPGTVYPYGDTFRSGACVGIDSGGFIQPTGSSANCEGGYPGIFDMTGNVWEWSATCTGASCSIRGGGSTDGPSGARCTTSFPYTTVRGANNEGIGFRCCMAPPTAE